ncbi:hypothetical protein A3B42_01290 [Candidatus Daviesbacteria bacterium RIFCSPLOWO2_01_FULL_38_10]|uniref:Uncharacterized protein n=1 Tax=Candidatus Daviesbacteria bacterium GW2011_GWF2_38_6 TaxID=1618432 RepID=A0A0G0MY47_9BACT|nr:MAG: hypothetical protein US99_C0017G0002 [Candidatus Daviesbacteria bacterium GW2011_GWF2_38_6]OGE26138.1 MAG: hypothetical protein A3D02_00545 [Candidatus Daviesbacteria bacterium RIFCSPHIGHO2_02_FULL_39_41]OGE37170.1 MAG: hypothetical protein A3B42_01290 [Candidatus Daviesbacteria bacterium RIFCSPLOWO2_01_FULL_38_10]OGE43799.1 MAG: hypothetical protein A3E67_03485 [Candidatus Daviesbacteria bacterium RIFCSPHIGHO2_12_FULL_38_25]OGE68230.1 MAG: hypothetical protein A3H81_04050 [Candidatus D
MGIEGDKMWRVGYAILSHVLMPRTVHFDEASRRRSGDAVGFSFRFTTDFLTNVAMVSLGIWGLGMKAAYTLGAEVGYHGPDVLRAVKRRF